MTKRERRTFTEEFQTTDRAAVSKWETKKRDYS